MLVNQKLITFIHRAGNPKSDYLGSLIASKNFVFDYRGKNTIVMILKAVLASIKLPKSDIYFVEGGLDLWPAVFKKIFYPKTKIIMMVPEPAFNRRIRSPFKNYLLKKIFGFVDYFLPISRLVVNDLKFYSSKPFSIVHHFYMFNREELLNIRPSYSKKNVLFVINRPEETGLTKGLDLVLDIFKLIWQKDHDWNIYIVGDGTKDLKINNDKTNHVYLEGFQSLQSLKQYFSICPFVLAPARYDAFPLAIVEACVAGLIPLISPTTGTEEFIREVDPSLIIDYKNKEGYAKKIINLYNLPLESKLNLSEKLRTEAKNFSKENSVKEFEIAIADINKVLKTNIKINL